MTQHLDPRAPWVISTHDLGRRPGSMRRMTLSLPAPADLGVDMIGVPKDAEVELDIRLEAVMEGVLVSGTAQAPLAGECARCLDPVTSEIEVDFQELFFYSDEDACGGAIRCSTVNYSTSSRRSATRRCSHCR